MRVHSLALLSVALLVASSTTACLDEPRIYGEVALPEGFDDESCAHITGPRAADAGDFAALRCGECCLEHGKRDSSFVLDDRCLCANLPPLQSDRFICQPSSSASECLACCDREGFAYGEGGDEPDTCVCWGPDDPDVCSDAFEYNDPGEACTACCVEAGYLGVELALGLGDKSCTCTR